MQPFKSHTLSQYLIALLFEIIFLVLTLQWFKAMEKTYEFSRTSYRNYRKKIAFVVRRQRRFFFKQNKVRFSIMKSFQDEESGLYEVYNLSGDRSWQAGRKPVKVKQHINTTDIRQAQYAKRNKFCDDSSFKKYMKREYASIRRMLRKQLNYIRLKVHHPKKLSTIFECQSQEEDSVSGYAQQV